MAHGECLGMDLVGIAGVNSNVGVGVLDRYSSWVLVQDC